MASLFKALGDRSWRAAFCELFEDPADNRGFVFIDAAFAVHGLRRKRSTLANHVITEAETASRFALTNAAFQAAPRFLSEVLQEQGVHGALEADMQFANLAFRQGDQPHAGKGKLLEQARDVLLVTREAIEGFGDKDLKAACPSILKHLLVTGPQGGGAADGMVRVDLT